MHSYLYYLAHFLFIHELFLQELKQYPALRVEVGNAAVESLERMRESSRKATLQLVDMESGYLTVDYFRKLPQDVEKGGNPSHSIFDRYNDSYLRRIGKCHQVFWTRNFVIIGHGEDKVDGSFWAYHFLASVGNGLINVRHSILQLLWEG